MLYESKNLVLRPRAWWRRRKYRGTDPIGIALMEHFRYTDPIFDHFAAIVEKPDLLLDFPLTAESTVFDVGGHVGEWCAPMSHRYGCRIEVFEPSPRALETLSPVVDSLTGVTVHPYGLSGASAMAALADKGPGSSTYDTDTRWTRTAVELRDVVGVLADLGDPHIDLMKINIEGGEYDLLERLLDSGRIGVCDRYVIQFHEWLPRAYWRRWRIRQRLRSTHRCRWNHPFVWEYWERVTD